MDPRRPRGAADRAPAGVSVPVHALVPAAGRGERFGGAKQFAPVAGRPLLAWTLERLLAAGVASVVVALPETELEPARRFLPADARLRLVAGGATRQASVAAALAASPAAGDDLVAVHDGARAAVAPADLRRAFAAAARAGGAILGRPATDTVKRVEDGRVLGTVERSALFLAETPQVFRRATLERAFEAARRDRFLGTDEASLVERLPPGERPEIAAVAAERPNPKLTYESELALVERLLAEEEER